MYSSSVYSCHLFLISSASIRSLLFLFFIVSDFTFITSHIHSWVLLLLWLRLFILLYKKDLHDPDNHDGMITHLEPDILESKVKWALGSIIMNKASGGDGIPVELFEILKDDAVKVMY